MRRRDVLELLLAMGAPAPVAARPDRALLIAALERLTDGLLFPSEADAPIGVVFWPRPGGGPTARRLAALVGEPHPDVGEEMTPDALLLGPSIPRAEDDAEERLVARRFAELRRFLETHLTAVRAFRFGHLTLRTYIVGATPNGDWLGLATTQTET